MSFSSASEQQLIDGLKSYLSKFEAERKKYLKAKSGTDKRKQAVIVLMALVVQYKVTDITHELRRRLRDDSLSLSRAELDCIANDVAEAIYTSTIYANNEGM